MKLKIWMGITVLVLLVSMLCLSGNLQLSGGKSAKEDAPAKVMPIAGTAHATPQTQSQQPKSRAPAVAAAAPPSHPTHLRQVERESLENLSGTLYQTSQPASSLNLLVEQLQKTGQQPLVLHDANPETGEMVIVRTKSPLPGTRYFHAQYFTGEDGQRFVQHMSFEFKPGPDSMAAAIATVEKTFANLSRPKVQRDDYVQWEWNGKYIVWVKKMAAADLRDDPFNSYSLNDAGTIRVAVELEIHGE